MKRLIFLETLCLRKPEESEYDLEASSNHVMISVSKENLKWSQESVDILRLICQETDASIVITDRNKRFYTMWDYEKMFGLYGWKNPPILGKTFSKTSKNFCKGEEIEEYLRSRNTEDYVILDVYPPELFEQYSIGVVKISKTEGLTLNKIKEIILTMMF